MIRNPLIQSVGRGRPDLQRLVEGVAASLRQFSVAQALYNDNDNDSNRNWNSSRQRTADAANELLGFSQPVKETTTNSASPSRTPAVSGVQPQRKIITVNKLVGGTGGRFAGFRKTVDANGTALAPRGGGSSALPLGRQNRGGTFAARAGRGGRGRGRGRGGRGRPGDDRPNRRRRPGEDGREESEDMRGYQAFKMRMEDNDVEFDAMMEKVECGTEQAFKPTLNILEDLAGYAPAVATASTPLAREATAIFWERMVGGRQAYDPGHWVDPQDAAKLYKEGEGVFFPNVEAKEWTSKTAGIEFKTAPEEVKTALLQSAYLGQYEGPKFADPNDTLGTIRSYVKRHGTYNPQAERMIEAKVDSLLPPGLKGNASSSKGGKAANP